MNITKEETQEMFRLADELYEVAQVNTLSARYELTQVRHDDLVQYVATQYAIDPDVNMSEQSHALSDILMSVVFKHAADARQHLIELLMKANISA